MNNKSSMAQRFRQSPWIWAFLGSLMAWFAMMVVKPQTGIEGLLMNAQLAAFLAIVSLGQMIVIATGEGGIDLSIPYVMTVTAFVSAILMKGLNGNLAVGILAAVGVGVFVGLINGLAIIMFSIPPIIVTMAVGFMITSVTLIFSNMSTKFKPSPLLSHIVMSNIGSIPLVIVYVVLIALFIAIVFNKSVYGRSLMATGQNRRASYLAGVQVRRTILIAYMVSGILASLGGLLLLGRNGGAFLSMGDPYLLESVGAVVIGGTLTSGGKATAIGTLFGSLFLMLVTALMEITGLPIGIQYVVQGVVIIIVLIVASDDGSRRKKIVEVGYLDNPSVKNLG